MTKSELIAKIAAKYPTLYLSDIEKIVFTIINVLSKTYLKVIELSCEALAHLALKS